MIKAGELRIGNIIIDHHGDVVTVTRIAERKLDVRFEDMTMTGTDSKYCDPIPLTPEWLGRCGYKKDNIDGKYYISGAVLPPIYFIYEGYWWIEGLPVTGLKFKYIHQLQNIYFLLTGEELSITL